MALVIVRALLACVGSLAAWLAIALVMIHIHPMYTDRIKRTAIFILGVVLGGLAVALTSCATQPAPPCDAATFARESAACLIAMRDCPPCDGDVCPACDAETQCNSWAAERTRVCNGGEP